MSLRLFVVVEQPISLPIGLFHPPKRGNCPNFPPEKPLANVNVWIMGTEWELNEKVLTDMGQKPCPKFLMPSAHSDLFKVPETYPGPNWPGKFLQICPSIWAEQTANIQGTGTLYYILGVLGGLMVPLCIWDAKIAENKLKYINVFAFWGVSSPGIQLNLLLLANFKNYGWMVSNIQKKSGN